MARVPSQSPLKRADVGTFCRGPSMLSHFVFGKLGHDALVLPRVGRAPLCPRIFAAAPPLNRRCLLVIGHLAF
jgi:hypothetical protein